MFPRLDIVLLVRAPDIVLSVRALDVNSNVVNRKLYVRLVCLAGENNNDPKMPPARPAATVTKSCASSPQASYAALPPSVFFL